MSAAKWHREQAADRNETPHYAWRHVKSQETVRDEAAHHALAADVLEALAVPGVAELLKDVAEARAGFADLYTDSAVHSTPEQRAALRTLADAAKEAK
jgi:hypothetical protein